VFAVLGDLFKPKTFAGLFGAAPSVALATLVLTISQKGKLYASIEARSEAFTGRVHTSGGRWRDRCLGACGVVVVVCPQTSSPSGRQLIGFIGL